MELYGNECFCVQMISELKNLARHNELTNLKAWL